MANAVPCLYDPIADTDGVPLGKTLSGEMVHLNLWSRETENWNVLVVGSSGTGKSFSINQLLIKNLPMNPYVMIIDKSQSYKTLCRLAGGRYLNYDLDSKHHLNIFDYPLDEIKEKEGEIDPEHISSIVMYSGGSARQYQGKPYRGNGGIGQGPASGGRQANLSEHHQGKTGCPY